MLTNKKHTSNTNRNQQQSFKQPYFSDFKLWKKKSRKVSSPSVRDLNYRNPNPTLSPAVAKDPVGFISKLPKTHKDILCYFTEQKARFRYIFPTQRTIAHWIGVSRETVNRALKDLISYGLVGSWYRHMTSCYYNLSAIFFSPYLRSQLANIITITALFHVSQLISGPLTSIFQKPLYYGIITHDLTQLYLKERDIYNLSLKTTKRRYFEVMPTIKEVKNREKKVYKVKQAVKDITTLNLSSLGECRLSAFPEEAILYADKILQNLSYQKKTEINNPFGFFFKLCNDYCKSHNVAIDWSITINLMEQCGVNGEGSPLSSAKINHISTPPALYESAVTNSHLLFEDKPLPGPVRIFSNEHKEQKGYKGKYTAVPQKTQSASKTIAEMIAHNKKMAEGANAHYAQQNSIAKASETDRLNAMDEATRARVDERASAFLKMLGLE